MKKMLNLLARMTTFAAFALTVVSVNATCTYLLHQPKLPESVNRLKF